MALAHSRKGLQHMKLSTVETCVLRAIYSFGDYEPYGNELSARITLHRGREMSFAVMYSALHALEKQKLITMRAGEATPERGDRPKYHFKLTLEGEKVLKNA